MYPTIGELDRVEVKTKVDPASVQVGDIIVYGSIAALAYVPYPQAMWICHRVVEKYEEAGTWCFRTKGDNNSYVDPWKVPAYWLLGVVTNIEHVNVSTLAPPASEEPSSISTPEETSNMFLVGGVAAILLIIAGALVSLRARGRRTENFQNAQENHRRIGMTLGVCMSRPSVQEFGTAPYEGGVYIGKYGEHVHSK